MITGTLMCANVKPVQIIEKIYIKTVLQFIDQSLLVIPVHSEKNLQIWCYSGLQWKHGYHDNWFCFKRNYRISSFKRRSVYLILGILNVVLIRRRHLLQKPK